MIKLDITVQFQAGTSNYKYGNSPARFISSPAREIISVPIQVKRSLVLLYMTNSLGKVDDYEVHTRDIIMYRIVQVSHLWYKYNVSIFYAPLTSKHALTSDLTQEQSFRYINF